MNDATTNDNLPDVQSSVDQRHIPIQRVGVRHVAHPMLVATPEGPQPVTAYVDMYVSLPASQKGTHMSRFPLLLDETTEPLDLVAMRGLMDRMLEKLGADGGYIEIRFTYFIKKTAPISRLPSFMNYEASFRASVENGARRFTQEIIAPVTSLCPCSKEISKYGAHNQRSLLTIRVEADDGFTLTDQIRIAEKSASCELFSRLKRADEKFVTEYAYEHPKFVEDIVRDTAVALNSEPRVRSYTVQAENFESIHNHSAYALIECDKRH